MLPGNKLLVRALTVSRHNYCSFMWRSTCIPLYPATDGQQTDNNFVADIQATCWRQHVAWCKRGFRVDFCKYKTILYCLMILIIVRKWTGTHKLSQIHPSTGSRWLRCLMHNIYYYSYCNYSRRQESSEYSDHPRLCVCVCFFVETSFLNNLDGTIEIAFYVLMCR